MDQALIIIFWLGSGLLLYTFLGYPVLVRFLGRLRGRSTGEANTSTPHASFTPPVSILLVVRDEADRIVRRIENLRETNYPRELLEVVVVSDGSTDGTPDLVRGEGGTSTRLIEVAAHRGKPACINDGMGQASGEVVVFADARQTFTPETIPALVAEFADPEVGAASGELLIGQSDSGVAVGVDAYWRLEKAIRLGESQIDSAIGCTGAVYAIRADCFEPLPEDTLLDDVVCPMQISLRGMRVLFSPSAKAHDPQKLEPHLERRRKRRTLAGNVQMFFRYPCWLLPWRNRLVIQLISHKYLRLAAPFLLLSTLVSCAVLAAGGSLFFSLITIGQAAFYVMAVIGMIWGRTRWKCFSLPAAFVFLSMMTLLGFIDYFTQTRKGGW